MYIYVLEDCEGKQYIGITTDLERRLSSHRKGKSDCSSTKLKYTTFEVVHYWNVSNFRLAYQFESYLHSLSVHEVIDIILDCPLWNKLLELRAKTRKINEKVFARLAQRRAIL